MSPFVIRLCGDEHRSRITPVDEVLRIESDLQTSHPVALSNVLLQVYVADPELVTIIDSWQIRTAIDSTTMARKGIAFDQILVRSFYGSGVSRRSALRLILAEASLGYVVIGDGIVITTKETADSFWNSVSENPTVSSLTHRDVTVRRDAAFAVGNCRVVGDAFFAPLLCGLNDTDRDVRLNCAYAIAAYGSDANCAVDALVAILVSDDFTMREVAKYSLSRIGRCAIGPLLTATENGDEDISDFAACALGDMGIAGRTATEGLIGVVTRHIAAEPDIHDAHCRRCRTIALAVAQVSTIDDRTLISQLFRSNSPGERAFASYVIGELGSSGMASKEIAQDNVEPELEALLFDQTIAVRRAAAWALACLDFQLETATRSLEAASQDSDRDVRRWAGEALRRKRARR